MKRKLEKPEICPGEYVLHLYCDHDNDKHDYFEFPHIPYDCNTKAEAHAWARKRGWVIHRDRTATCPKCK